MDYQVNHNEMPEWLGRIDDSQLRLELSSSAFTHDFTGAIRTAFVHLERRIRDSVGLEDHYYGKPLIDKAFHPENGILQPVSPDGGERAGLHHLLLGIFLYYRNPIAHRSMYHTEEPALAVISLIDHALQLVDMAVEISVDLKDFVGQHEGQILRRRNYRLDIDGDGEQEVVVLLELGPVTDEEHLTPHLMPIILKKSGRGYRRIPSEGVRGVSMHGPIGVAIHHVTSVEQPDVVVSWTFGESQSLSLILRQQEGRYVLARREIAPGTEEPYSGPIEKGFLIHMRQELDFTDVDGDGLVEMVQTLLFDGEDLREMGYPDRPDDPDERLALCRLLKWDAEKERIMQVDEQLVTQRLTLLPGYL